MPSVVATITVKGKQAGRGGAAMLQNQVEVRGKVWLIDYHGLWLGGWDLAELDAQADGQPMRWMWTIHETCDVARRWEPQASSQLVLVLDELLHHLAHGPSVLFNGTIDAVATPDGVELAEQPLLFEETSQRQQIFSDPYLRIWSSALLSARASTADLPSVGR